MTAAAASLADSRPGLGAWALFSAPIAAAGLPIYIHAPKFYVDELWRRAWLRWGWRCSCCG